MTLCGDSPGVKHFRGEWEKLHFHSFAPPLTAEMNMACDCPGTPVSYRGLICFALLLEGKFPVGRIHVRFTLWFSLRVVHEGSLFYEYLQQGNSMGAWTLYTPFPYSHPPLHATAASGRGQTIFLVCQTSLKSRDGD